MVEKSTIWIALPHPYRWSTVEIVTQNPVDGRKIDHLDFSSTTHQWSTVEITTRNPEPPPNLSVREDELAQKRKDLQAQLSSLNPIEENTKLEQISRVLDGSAAIVDIKKPKKNPKSRAKPKLGVRMGRVDPRFDPTQLESGSGWGGTSPDFPIF
ncbi:hypothetical protein PGT21_030112 [Puccinia graminis f. sp. tritici]|uniref:Uncharacterized protein n=1 Tax=Puccinia graminis f. sp. tritici TaxID=56615 RepID=A0A5B0PZA3_PUCGR|nr:hypothetical protein PGT21_030112 [Puccinia graminis f. sp. tritici]